MKNQWKTSQLCCEAKKLSAHRKAPARTGGGKAPQFKESQPLTEGRGCSAHTCGPRKQGGPKPPQMNMNGVSKYKP